jgi:transposase
MSKLRRKFSASFKAKVAIEALQERETIEFLSKKHDVHPNQILRWKKEMTENSSKLFSSEPSGSDKSERLIDELYKQIGQLKVDNDWLKKKLS